MENGANWIHGQFDDNYCDDEGRNCGNHTTREFMNSMWKYQQKFYGTIRHMDGSFTDYNSLKVMYQNGTQLPEKDIDECWDQIIEAEDTCSELNEEPDMTIRNCYEKHINLTGLNEKICKSFIWEEVEFETAIFNASLKHNIPLNGRGNHPYNDRDYLVTDPRGYQYIMEAISEDFSTSIIFNQKVNEIKHSEQGVQVITENGTKIDADYAICTVSLGVLQSNFIKFDPDFDDKKKKAISRLEMGFYAKIYVTFPKNVWKDDEVLMYVSEDQEPHESIMTWCLNLDHPKYFKGSKMLTCHSMGPTAKRIESQTTTETKDEVNKIMAHMFRGEQEVDRTVENIHVTSWSNNSLFYGAYSDVPVGVTQQELDLVKKNVGRLYFAGEHTADNKGFVHSAYDSGKNVSALIIADMRDTSGIPSKIPSKIPHKTPTTTSTTRDEATTPTSKKTPTTSTTNDTRSTSSNGNRFESSILFKVISFVLTYLCTILYLSNNITEQ